MWRCGPVLGCYGVLWGVVGLLWAVLDRPELSWGVVILRCGLSCGAVGMF
jgi:hypothetical protein